MSDEPTPVNTDDDAADAEEYRLLQADALLSRFYEARPEATGRPRDEQMRMLEEWATKNITGPIEPTEGEVENFFLRKSVKQAKDETGGRVN